MAKLSDRSALAALRIAPHLKVQLGTPCPFIKERATLPKSTPLLPLQPVSDPDFQTPIAETVLTL